jgi:hypothetical protein
MEKCDDRDAERTRESLDCDAPSTAAFTLTRFGLCHRSGSRSFAVNPDDDDHDDADAEGAEVATASHHF